MEKYCKNCGAKIDETTVICPDCKREVTINKPTRKRCLKCGEPLTGYEHYCRNCGTDLNASKSENNFLNQYKTPIIIIAVIAVIAIIAFGAFASLTPFGTQDVQVDTIDFKIPQGFTQDDDLTFNETEDGVRYVSKYWDDGEDDEIQIDVTYSAKGNANASDVAKELGGDKQNMMGHDGYYEELQDSYSFTFVKDNKVVSVYTTNQDLLNEIEVL